MESRSNTNIRAFKIVYEYRHHSKLKSKAMTMSVRSDNTKVMAMCNGDFSAANVYSLPYRFYGNKVTRVISVTPN